MIDYKNHVLSNPKIMFGKPCIKGTRVPVDLILEKLAWGESIQQLLQAYPHITENDILACLHYAVAMMRNEHIIPLAA
jgi:uncharacterized protein (DUF433 family)